MKRWKKPTQFFHFESNFRIFKNTQITKNGWSWKVETFHVSGFQQGSLLGSSGKIKCAHTHKQINTYLNKCLSDWENNILSYSVQALLRVGDLLFSEMENLSQTKVCLVADCLIPVVFTHQGHMDATVEQLCTVFAESSSSLHTLIFPSAPAQF